MGSHTSCYGHQSIHLYEHFSFINAFMHSFIQTFFTWMNGVLGVILGIWIVSTILAIPMAVGYRVEVTLSFSLFFVPVFIVFFVLLIIILSLSLSLALSFFLSVTVLPFYVLDMVRGDYSAIAIPEYIHPCDINWYRWTPRGSWNNRGPPRIRYSACAKSGTILAPGNP